MSPSSHNKINNAKSYRHRDDYILRVETKLFVYFDSIKPIKKRHSVGEIAYAHAYSFNLGMKYWNELERALNSSP